MSAPHLRTTVLHALEQQDQGPEEGRIHTLSCLHRESFLCSKLEQKGTPEMGLDRGVSLSQQQQTAGQRVGVTLTCVTMGSRRCSIYCRAADLAFLPVPTASVFTTTTGLP